MPRWRGDGRELFYRAADGTLMAVAVSHGAADSFEPGTFEPLFHVPESRINQIAFTYQPSRDGQRFLVALPVADERPPIAVVVNWQAAVQNP